MSNRRHLPDASGSQVGHSFLGSHHSALVAGSTVTWETRTAVGHIHAMVRLGSGVGADTGQELWSLNLGDEVHSSSDVEDGVIYLGTGDGYGYAIDLIALALLALGSRPSRLPGRN